MTAGGTGRVQLGCVRGSPVRPVVALRGAAGVLMSVIIAYKQQATLAQCFPGLL
jgi:hypothetical protein